MLYFLFQWGLIIVVNETCDGFIMSIFRKLIIMYLLGFIILDMKYTKRRFSDFLEETGLLSLMEPVLVFFKNLSNLIKYE